MSSLQSNRGRSCAKLVLMHQIDEDIEAGQATAREAREFREEVRWRVRKDDPDRRAHVDQLLDSIDDAMKPIRSHVGRLVHEPLPAQQERDLRECSAALQYERRQLKKMKR